MSFVVVASVVATCNIPVAPGVRHIAEDMVEVNKHTELDCKGLGIDLAQEEVGGTRSCSLDSSVFTSRCRLEAAYLKVIIIFNTSLF